MNKFFLYAVLLLGFCATGCQQQTQTADNAQDTVIFPNLVQVHITGKVAVPDGTKVQVKTDKKTMQPLLSARVQDGAFVLIGELDEPNFYELTVDGQTFQIYLENGKQYAFVGEVDAAGKLQSGRINTDSETMNDYERYTKELEKKRQALDAQSAKLRTTMDNPDTYQQNVAQSIAIGEQRKDLPNQINASFLRDKNVSHAFKLYLIKEDKVSKVNYEHYHELLNGMPDSIKGTMLFRASALKVKHVRDFYENMPDFPIIHPRNLTGDSLMLERFRGNGTLLFVFWGSWNDEARNDIQEIKKKTEALQALGVTPIYITWERNYESWKKASEALGLGKHNYRLNTTDKDFMAANYGVNRLPHYLLVNADNLSVINERFTYPLDGLLENKLKKELGRD